MSNDEIKQRAQEKKQQEVASFVSSRINSTVDLSYKALRDAGFDHVEAESRVSTDCSEATLELDEYAHDVGIGRLRIQRP